MNIIDTQASRKCGYNRMCEDSYGDLCCRPNNVSQNKCCCKYIKLDGEQGDLKDRCISCCILQAYEHRAGGKNRGLP